MPTIPIINYQAGDPMVAADANGDFTNFQAYSAILDQDNTRTEWCSRGHLGGGSNFINMSFSQITDSDTTMVVNSTTFNVVALAPNFRITYGGFPLKPGETLRMHFDINVVEATYGNGGTVLPTLDSDCYQFRFYYRDATSGLVNPIGPTSTYSTTNKSDHIPSGGGGSPSPVNRIGQRVNHSYAWINTTGADINIDWLEIRVRVCDLAYVSSISIKEATFQAFFARH